ncbi:MAG: hypothetical protein LC667_12920 [Thioalkalivibrio sp.]|nr:hypothetical protein [Thioalkalivibrio sp.]
MDRVLELEERLQDNYLVRHRIERNVTRSQQPDLTEENLWYALVSCLLTTQQRSGPSSSVNRFVLEKPFPLRLDECRRVADLKGFVTDTVKEFGGIRRGPTIAKELAVNLEWLEAGGWSDLESVVTDLQNRPGGSNEREAARKLRSRVRGFGPKQARNFLQMLGLTQHEIPLDSRIVKWLRAAGFPIPLVSSALGEQEYYEFVMDRVQELCAAADILPCVFDALVFASADAEEWAEDNLVW